MIGSFISLEDAGDSLTFFGLDLGEKCANMGLRGI